MQDPNFPPNLAIKPSETSGRTDALAFDQESGIKKYGIAGRVWEAAYTLATYTSPPANSTSSIPTIEFDPPCSLFRVEADQVPTIIEVGSGTGYAGLHLAQQLNHFYRKTTKPNPTIPAQAQVILTDLDNVVPLLEDGIKDHMDSIEGGLVRVHACALAWGDLAQVARLNTSAASITHVLCSDLVYFPHLYPPLLRTLLALTSPPFCNPPSSPEVIIGYKVRSLTKETPFWQVFGTWFAFEPVLARQTENDRKVTNEWDRFGRTSDIYIFVAKRRPESFRWDVPTQDSQLMNGYGPTPPTLDDTFESLLLLGIAEDS
ncbi:hypothetical protein BDV93DRAFT_468036 [Ceratobasidium sp. AG-I]|nr:hypothetical protein BDV93DRAFT_468036 [Ceratobasidium sp. AG-I]